MAHRASKHTESNELMTPAPATQGYVQVSQEFAWGISEASQPHILGADVTLTRIVRTEFLDETSRIEVLRFVTLAG